MEEYKEPIEVEYRGFSIRGFMPDLTTAIVEARETTTTNIRRRIISDNLAGLGQGLREIRSGISAMQTLIDGLFSGEGS